MASPYSAEFYGRHEKDTRTSARVTVPIVLDFVPAKSVVDVGCGIGIWLSEFQAAGVSDILGIDGDYVQRTQLAIPPERFMSHDLTRPIVVNRTFDLAVCLEVAEHLPDASAPVLLESLARLAPVILFSAAIPGQRGINHVNEQWHSYWYKKFAAIDYLPVDCLRMAIWGRRDVSGWYKQNTVFYVRSDRLPHYPKLNAAYAPGSVPPDLVHPDVFVMIHNVLTRDLQEAQRASFEGMFTGRRIKLMAFPDWRLPEPQVRAQVCALYKALIAHPQRSQMTLLIRMPDPSIAWARTLLQDMASGKLAEVVPSAEGPHLVALGPDFPPDKWKSLIEQLPPFHIELEGEDTRGIAVVGAGHLPRLTMQSIEAKGTL